MSENEYVKQLEERVQKLEKLFDDIIIGEGNNIVFQDCHLGDITIGEGCNLSFNDCSIGSCIEADIDDAECRIDDLEDRLQDIISQIEDLEDQS